MKKTFLFGGIVASLLLTACPKVEEDYYWSKDVDKDFKFALGEHIKDLPVFTAGTIDHSISDTDADGIKFATVYINPAYKISLCNTAYETVLRENDFTYMAGEGGLYRYAKSVTMEYTMYVTYGGYKDKQTKKDMFAIEAFLYKDKSETWPEEEIVSVLGKNIPVIDAPYYVAQTGVQYETEIVQILCFGLDETSETTYYGLLQKAGYVVRTNASACNAVNHDDLINIDFYYDFDYAALLIQAYLLDDSYAWPAETVRQLLGMDLPIYSDPAVTYTSGNAQLDEEHIFYTIGCDYAPSSCMSTYTNQLINAGWVKEGEDEDLPDYWPIFLGEFARFKYGDDLHSIEIRYYDPSNPLLSGYDNLYYPIMLIIIYY